MKKIGRTIGVSVLACSLFATPVMATPDIDTLKENKAQAQSEANALQSELTALLTKINDLEIQLVEKGQEVVKVTDELAAAEEKEKKQYEDMKLRIKYMYEQGESNLESLLNSGSTSEALNQAGYIQEIHNYDRRKFDEYVETKETVKSLKSELETEMKELEEAEVQFEEEKASLDSALTSKQAEVAELGSQLEAAQEEAARQAAAAAAAAAERDRDTTDRDRGQEDPKDEKNDDSDYTPPANTGGGSAIVNAAYGYMGVPYVWGGESASGVDCSGLVMLAHRAIGVRLSHSSGSIGGGGKSVSHANALPGDVVCYSGHVGIYIGGDQMIHAPRPGKSVCVTSIYSNGKSFWFRRYW